MQDYSLYQYALAYAKKGLSVFPLKPRSKIPATVNGFKDSTTDLNKITAWWNENPAYNIGIATGDKSNNVFVVDFDIDDEKGVNGYHNFTDWCREHGVEFPDTISTITGRGGYHWFYHSDTPIKSRVGIIEGVDIRGNGGYIVAPPSMHPNGRQYEWEVDFNDMAIAEANDVVLEFLAESESEENATQGFELPQVVQSGQRNATFYKMACSLQAKGLSDDVIMAAVVGEATVRCQPPLSAKEQKELEKTIKSALSKKKGKLRVVNGLETQSNVKQYIPFKTKENKDGSVQIVQEAQNVVLALTMDERLKDKICYNELSFSPYVRGTLPWSDKENEYREWGNFDDSSLCIFIETEYGLKSKEKTMDALNQVMHQNRFNPVTDWLESLEWDGKPRMEQLLQTYLGVKDSIYTRECMRVFMLGAISRAYTAGTKFDYMPVLVGSQGVGKSTFFRKLACNSTWYDDNFNTIEGDKACEKLRGMWIVEMAELLATKRAKEVEAIKAFITSTNDSYRPPYGRRTEQRPRMCVFAGTTNSNHFLSDRTGNRRFLPLKVDKNNIKKSLFENEDDVNNDFEQAWAEALTIYNAGDFKLVLSAEAQAIADSLQGQYVEDDYRVGIIQDYLSDLSMQCEYVCIAQIWDFALGNEGQKMERRYSNELHDIMAHSIKGWHRVDNESGGRVRTAKYGVQICYERDKDNPFEPLDGESPFND